ncbi:DUF4124 domain-containing protein [Pelomicrobium sp. G1]|uniref:DUF4124 domain-containing protein n=1 Tax=unclassified Pelomicrobium TaxID=2815318 RepID=UPI0021DC7E5B|nr:MAG: hypothetical protein KatS3mg123_2905 [Burkholderiales bacterium]
MIRRGVVAAWLLAVPWAAQADIYKYVDEEGRITFTNIPRKGAIKLDIDTGSSLPPPSAARPTPRPTPRTTPTPANFPRISREEQRQRDALRRQVLEQELATETRLLDQARRALAQARSAQASAPQALADAVRLHEQNVNALQYELSLLPR